MIRPPRLRFFASRVSRCAFREGHPSFPSFLVRGPKKVNLICRITSSEVDLTDALCGVGFFFFSVYLRTKKILGARVSPARQLDTTLFPFPDEVSPGEDRTHRIDDPLVHLTCRYKIPISAEDIPGLPSPPVKTESSFLPFFRNLFFPPSKTRLPQIIYIFLK